MSSGLKIVLVCSSYGRGGAERVAVNLGSALCEEGHQVFFYHWDDSGDQAYSVDSRIQIEKAPKRNLFARVLGLRQLLRKQLVDVLIGFTDTPNIVCYGTLFGQRKRPAFITTIHNDLRMRDENLGSSWKARLLKRLHRQACLRASRVVAVSDGARRTLIDYYRLPASAVVRIYNPVLANVDVSVTKPEIAPPLKLVSAGRLTQQKNYPLMIRAVKLLVDKYHTPCHLNIYGEGESGIELQDLIDDLGMKHTVTLCGFVPNLRDLLAGNDVFLLSSTWEGFGNVLVEALEAGLRIVSTDCPSGPNEILADGKYGVLVPSNDAEQMAQAIIATVGKRIDGSNDDLSLHLRQFTHAHAARQYSRLIASVVR